MSKLKLVLLIDDDEINNFLNKRLLEKYGIAEQVAIVTNGEEGLEFIAQRCRSGAGCPELILLDISMPVMDGFEFLKQYQRLNFKNKDKVNLIVLTTSSNPNDMERIANFNVTDYLTKPLNEGKVEYLLERFYTD